MEALGKFIVGLALGVAQSILLAFAVSAMWQWFVVPLGVPAINIVHAIALVIFVRFVTRDVDWDKPTKKWAEQVEDTLKTIFYIALTLLVSYILHFYV